MTRRLTRHNGRFGKNGVYNSRHNDRRFRLQNSEHIDQKRTAQNIYWDCYNGIYHPGSEQKKMPSFEQVEKQFYEEHYRDYSEKQNARNEANRHPDKNRTVEQIRLNKKNCPEESIYQMGTMGDAETSEDLCAVFLEYLDWFQESFGGHIHVLTWALHMDESTPHIHEKHVFDARNRYGELVPQQEEALLQLGFELPDPDKPKSKTNNRKIVFDAVCRTKLFDIAKSHGITLEEEPEYGGRAYLEKQDYILKKQKESIRDQTISIEKNEEHLKELTMKISDAETLIENIADEAYDRAVSAVAETVCHETQQHDLSVMNQLQKRLLAPEASGKEKERKYAAKILEHIKERISSGMESFSRKLLQRIQSPEKREQILRPVKEEARRSVLSMLRTAKKDSKQTGQKSKNLHKERVRN